MDGSRYLTSVCDHAAWVAGRLEAGVHLLHVREGATASASGDAPELLAEAASRLEDSGAAPREVHIVDGSLAPTIARLASAGALVVIGRRGCRSERVKRGVGRNVEAIVKAAPAPVLVVARLFLPPSEVLLIDDPSQPDPGFAKFVETSTWLDGLSLRRAVTDQTTGGVRLATSPPSNEAPRPGGLDRAFEPRADLILAPRGALSVENVRAPLRRAVQAWLRSRRSLLFC